MMGIKTWKFSFSLLCTVPPAGGQGPRALSPVFKFVLDPFKKNKIISDAVFIIAEK